MYACEKDDFCVSNPVTPNLIIRFYNAAATDELKGVSTISVWADDLDTIYNDVTTDSIAIPLNTLTTNTNYNFMDGTGKIESFSFSYSTEDEYVSRSCGFKVIFNEVIVTNTTTEEGDKWVSSFTPDTITTVDNQNSAHVKIYH